MYKFLPHTADFRMYVRAASPEELFKEALLGMMKVLKSDLEAFEDGISESVELKAGDMTVLLIDFLNEVLTLAQTNKEIYTDVDFEAFGETHLKANLRGARVDEFDEDIKAVTYHEADVVQNAKGEWETNLVFDI